MYSSEGSEAGTVDDTEVGQGAHCSAAKYGVLVERSETEVRSMTERGPLMFCSSHKCGKRKKKKGKSKTEKGEN